MPTNASRSASELPATQASAIPNTPIVTRRDVQPVEIDKELLSQGFGVVSGQPSEELADFVDEVAKGLGKAVAVSRNSSDRNEARDAIPAVINDALLRARRLGFRIDQTDESAVRAIINLAVVRAA